MIVADPPEYKSTRDKMDMLLGQMSEADLVRTLHFVQQQFFTKAA